MDILHVIYEASSKAIIDNFWTIFIIILLYLKEETYWAGLVLTTVRIFLGYIPSDFLVLLVIILFCYNFLSAKSYWKKIYANKYRKLENEYRIKYEKLKKLTNRSYSRIIDDLEIEDLNDDGSC